MKYTLIILLLILVAYHTAGQTFDEWFKQKKTQRKYLLEQIAALQVYSGYLQKGYQITEQGLKVIGNINKGDFNLHSDFFGSLRSINPRISEYTKVTDMDALQINIVQVCKDSYRQAQTSGLFNLEELHYILEVVSNLITDFTGLIDEFNSICTSSQLQMKDDERLKQIDRLYGLMHDELAFVQSFSAGTRLLAIQRSKVKFDVQTSRALNGIKSK